MSHARPLCRVAAVLAVGLGTGGCTVVKPVVGAICGPVVLLGSSNGSLGCGCGDGRAIVVVFAIAAAVGATGGLVTGIISDFQVVFGDVEHPTANWWQPFKTNTSPVTDP